MGLNAGNDSLSTCGARVVVLELGSNQPVAEGEGRRGYKPKVYLIVAAGPIAPWILSAFIL